MCTGVQFKCYLFRRVESRVPSRNNEGDNRIFKVNRLIKIIDFLDKYTLQINHTHFCYVFKYRVTT